MMNLPMYSPKKYSFQLLNAISVRNKIDFIIHLIIDFNFSIYTITETWPTNDYYALDFQMKPECFKLLLSNRSFYITSRWRHRSVILIET